MSTRTDAELRVELLHHLRSRTNQSNLKVTLADTPTMIGSSGHKGTFDFAMKIVDNRTGYAAQIPDSKSAACGGRRDREHR
ncbi:hypothetical protein FAZ95_26405 [Trinickia violacea]|uniref:Uncharacterized protein n=1 Tax=Trinickia violacea TaxID=2571746 RepID=A0A4P8IYN4_9BURK|nr:hypothetical protein [Trinickia violacea]QCP52683.1 hypothetical protein FAZ95_26405 [Trinickia violacea]